MPRIGLTTDWSIELDPDFKRRIEEDQLVFWRPKQTLWISIWENDEDRDGTFSWLKEDSNPNPLQAFETTDGNLKKYAYLLSEGDGDGKAWALNTFCVSSSSHAYISYYFDDKDMLDWAIGCWKSTQCQEEVSP